MKKSDDNMVMINLRIPPELLARLQEFCKRKMATRAMVIRRGIELVMEKEDQ